MQWQHNALVRPSMLGCRSDGTAWLGRLAQSYFKNPVRQSRLLGLSKVHAPCTTSVQSNLAAYEQSPAARFRLLSCFCIERRLLPMRHIFSHPSAN